MYGESVFSVIIFTLFVTNHIEDGTNSLQGISNYEQARQEQENKSVHTYKFWREENSEKSRPSSKSTMWRKRRPCRPCRVCLPLRSFQRQQCTARTPSEWVSACALLLTLHPPFPILERNSGNLDYSLEPHKM
nr:unnamed protein product [Callosobruchus chinensis]